MQRQKVPEDSRHRQHHIDARSAELLQRNKARAAQAAISVEARFGADKGERLADRHALGLEIVGPPEDDCDGFRKRMAVRGIAGEDAIGLSGALGDREGARNAIGIETMQVAAGRQDRRRPNEIAADDWSDETPVERPYAAPEFSWSSPSSWLMRANSSKALRASCICGAGERCNGRVRRPGRDDRAHRGAGIAKTERALGDCRQRPGALLGAGRLAENVQTVGDERVFEFEDRGAELVDFVARAPPPGRLGLGEVNGGSLRLNEFGKQAALMIGLGFTGAVAVERRLQVDETAIKSGMGEARREIADEGRGRPALRQRALGRIVRSIEIDVGHGADQALGPACGRKPDLLARHEFERSVHAEMQHHVGAEILAQVPVEGRKGMRRSEAAIKQQAHGVAFVTHGGLNPDQHVSKTLAQHEQRGAVRLMPARRGAPLRLDLREMRLAPDVIVDIDARDNIGAGAEARVVALDDPLAQRVDRLRDLDGVAGFLHRLQGLDAATRKRPGTPRCLLRPRWAGS